MKHIDRLLYPVKIGNKSLSGQYLIRVFDSLKLYTLQEAKNIIKADGGIPFKDKQDLVEYFTHLFCNNRHIDNVDDYANDLMDILPMTNSQLLDMRYRFSKWNTRKIK